MHSYIDSKWGKQNHLISIKLTPRLDDFGAEDSAAASKHFTAAISAEGTAVPRENRPNEHISPSIGDAASNRQTASENANDQ